MDQIDFEAYKLAARQARAEAMRDIGAALLSLFRRKPALRLAEAAHAR